MTPSYIIIHTAAARIAAGIEDIDRWHKEMGFRRKGTHDLQHVGYQYYIRKDGTIQRGRDETEVGAHCKDMGMNRKSIGICFEGHGDYDAFTRAQRKSLSHLYQQITGRWDIPIENVLGHRETGAKKTCPGNKIDMHELRNSLSCDSQAD